MIFRICMWGVMSKMIELLSMNINWFLDEMVKIRLKKSTDWIVKCPPKILYTICYHIFIFLKMHKKKTFSK